MVQVVKSKIRLKNENLLKRRIYDALNVLIATNVIERFGKYIHLSPNFEGHSKSHLYNQIFQMSIEIEKAKTRHTDKRNELQSLTF